MIHLLLFIAFSSFISCNPFEDGVCIWKRSSCGACLCQEDHRMIDKYFCNCQRLPPMKDCAAFLKKGYATNGVYIINPHDGMYVQVFCDQVTDGGGWIVFQRRLDGSINFYRDWENYKNGFGAPQHEFWLGNDNLSNLTSAVTELRIEMKYWVGQNFYAKYNTFHVGNETSNYKLQLSGYSGSISDEDKKMGFTDHNGKTFSTFDRDNDSWSKNCAEAYKGGWWYGSCHSVNLNGRYYYYKEAYPYASGIHWNAHDRYKQSMSYVEMKLRTKYISFS